ncbi:WAT1-related protein At5g64700-like isoform X2 [Oryza glaberrima]|uniref:WAT1-related protein At5g64700-like isoform X2 n=1 Tax=Oryza glaberrima TaxID=4538 RepID=UPI00224BE7B2|nr:WAT1-related protein At5g64700-like isoform X2 [Oryza glaberrima]
MDITGAGAMGGGSTAATAAAAAGGGWKTPVSMVLVQLFITGQILLSKVSIGGGMLIFVLLAYNSFFAVVFLLPFALIFERYSVPMSLYYYGLKDTTSSYSVIFLNITPLFTFILSLMFRLEAFKLRSIPGVLKIASILLSIGGTMLISLYKGKSLHLWDSIIQHQNEHKSATNQLRGTILLVGSSFTFACWFLIQSKILKVYPYKYWSSMVTCLVGVFQTALVGIILRRDKSAWELGWNLNLVTIVYTGALATAGKYILNSWAITKRGPTYPTMFSPLSVVFTVVLDSVLLGNDITIGSLLGTALVIVGLYLFLWAKAREMPKKST